MHTIQIQTHVAIVEYIRVVGYSKIVPTSKMHAGGRLIIEIHMLYATHAVHHPCRTPPMLYTDYFLLLI